MKGFEYVAPESVEEARKILSDHGSGARILGGGTDLVVALRKGILRPSVLVSVKKIDELKSMRFDRHEGLSIGAGVTLSQIEDYGPIRDNFPIIAEAAGSVASLQIRNRATIGGNICLDSRCWYYNQSTFWKKSYPDCRKIGGNTCYVVKGGSRCYALLSADTVPALIALDARVRIVGAGGERTVALEDIYSGTGDPVNALKRDELVVEVDVPVSSGRYAYYRKYQPRPSIDFALLTLAVSATKASSHLLQDIRIVLGGVDSGPVRAQDAEALWQAMAREGSVDAEKVAASAAKETRVYNTYNGSAAYKKRIVQELVREAVTDLTARATQR